MSSTDSNERAAPPQKGERAVAHALVAPGDQPVKESRWNLRLGNAWNRFGPPQPSERTADVAFCVTRDHCLDDILAAIRLAQDRDEEVVLGVARQTVQNLDLLDYWFQANRFNIVLARHIGDKLINVGLCSRRAHCASGQVDHKGEDRWFERMDGRLPDAFADRESFELREIRLFQ